MARAAFIGLGVMGFPMAGHLQAKGHAVTVYNRSADKAGRWCERFGGCRAATPREAASGWRRGTRRHPARGRVGRRVRVRVRGQ